MHVSPGLGGSCLIDPMATSSPTTTATHPSVTKAINTRPRTSSRMPGGPDMWSSMWASSVRASDAITTATAPPPVIQMPVLTASGTVALNSKRVLVHDQRSDYGLRRPTNRGFLHVHRMPGTGRAHGSAAGWGAGSDTSMTISRTDSGCGVRALVVELRASWTPVPSRRRYRVETGRRWTSWARTVGATGMRRPCARPSSACLAHRVQAGVVGERTVLCGAAWSSSSSSTATCPPRAHART